MHRLLISVTLFCAATSISAGVVAAAAEEKRQNVILIMADDVGYECFGCYGSRQYRTPNIDRMAGRGMRFAHCYSQPLCTPSRIKLMTGLSNARNYSGFSILNRDERTIGHYFQQAGYRTMVAGKWQLLGAEHYAKRFRGKGTRPEEAGFDESCLWQVDRLGGRYWEPLLSINGENRQFGKDEYGPEICTEHITDFIEKNREKPFFVYYPMIEVHSPFLPSPDSASRESKNRQRNFEDMVAYTDRLVGRIVKKTEELGIAENTLILFTGDNGTHRSLQSRLNGRVIQGGKGKTTDAGTRVALVAYQPGTVPAGRVCEDLVDFSDFLPTCLEAIGAEVPEGLDGRSFLSQIQGKPGNPRKWIYCYYNPRPERTKPQRFVRDQRWKLYGDGRFFDVANDVLEKEPITEVEPGSEAATAKRKLAAALASMPAEGQRLLQFAAGGEDKRGEWLQLFNGKDLTGWTPKITGYEARVNFGKTFRVEDGVLKVAYDAYDSFDGRFGHLFYERPFSHYLLRAEYRFTGEQVPGGPSWAVRNSGLMLHGQSPESMTKDQNFPVSIEVQLLGGTGSGERPTANLCTPGTHVVIDGKLVKRHCTRSASKTYHGDGWVTVEVEVRGDKVIRHKIDGETVLEYTAPQLDEADADARKLIKEGNTALTGGTISLQSESHPVEFRRVELRVLEE